MARRLYTLFFFLCLPLILLRLLYRDSSGHLVHRGTLQARGESGVSLTVFP